MATTTRPVFLPAGTYSGWELDDEEMNAENGEWHNVADSLVILQSLRQSREKWLASAFPKFSGRARGTKQPEVRPPAHSVKSHSRFELSVGPHVFSNTRLYEIHYLPEHPIPVASHTPAPANASSTHIAPSTSYFNGNAQARYNDFVTPALLEQVTQAAATDPILLNLLTLAQRNQLSEDQRATLTAFIRSMNERLGPSYGGSEVSPAMPSSGETPPAPRPFDLVIEFQERLSDRWLIPRGTVHLADTYAGSGGSLYDVIVAINLPLAQSTSIHQVDDPMTGEDPTVHTQAVKLHWKGLQQDSYDILMAWSRGDTGSGEPQHVSNPTKRTYLAHQLPDGELLEILKAAVTPYQMKSIKPSNADSTKTRRKAPARKSAVEKPANVPNPGGMESTLNFAATTSGPQVSVPSASVSSTPMYVPPPPTEAPSFNQSVFPVFPRQHVLWVPPPPPSGSHPPPPPQFVTPPPLQFSSPIQQYPSHPSTTLAQSPPPPPITLAGGPLIQQYGVSSTPHPQPSSSGNTQNDYTGSGVSFAPISTPASEAKVVENHQKKASRPKPKKLPSVPMPPPIRCRACQETDLPLLMGGRICRRCLESGRLSEAIPDATSSTTPTEGKSPSEPESSTSTPQAD